MNLQSQKNFLYPLTSFRFFAAAMIVWLHFEKNFGIPKNSIPFIYLEQGVSFFFVLSGFILTYNYFNLNSFSNIKKFYLNRLARIWPLHFATFIITLVIVPTYLVFPYGGDFYNKTKILVANILLLHSWIPNLKYYFSINAVSWSISVELFFYLCFPFLIKELSRTWKIKLLLLTAALLFCFYACWAFSIPPYNKNYDGITISGLINAGPVARIFEFFIGMITAMFYFQKRRSLSSSHETLALSIVVIAMAFSRAINNFISFQPLIVWVKLCGSFWGFAFLIYIFSQSNGVFSKILSNKWLVYLGEASFALYLVHPIPLILYEANEENLWNLSNPIKLILFSAGSILLAILAHEWIEKPARKWILKSFIIK